VSTFGAILESSATFGYNSLSPMKLAVDPALGKRIASLSAPVVLAMISQTAINLVDHALIGRLPVSEASSGQTAVTISLILMWAVGGSLSAISVGAQALTARRFGEKENTKAGQVMINAIMVAVVSSTVLAIAGWFLVPYVFPYFHPNPQVVKLGMPFLRWRMIGVVSMVTAIAYKSWFDGLGHTRVHMGAALTMNVINFFLNIALIFGKWGAPRMGVEGSGLASMISSYIGMGLMILWSLLPEYRVTYENYHPSRLSMKQQWEIIKLSAPSAVATIFVMSGFGMFVKIAGLLDQRAGDGVVYATVTSNIINILMLAFTACIAYGTATATLVGQSMGAKEIGLAERYGWEAVKLGVYITAVIGIGIVLLPNTVLHVFTRDESVVSVGRPILQICGLLLPCILAAIVLTQALFGAGNTRFVMFVEFGLHFFCLVPLAYINGIRLGLGILGVWSGAFAYVLLLCGIMGWKFAEGGWKHIQI
jgi:putative MATE family efflux protein